MKILFIFFMSISLFGNDYSSMLDSFNDGNTNRAIAFARQNATQGNEAAMYDLALLYYAKGDIKKAEKWFNDSVKKGGRGILALSLITFSKAKYSDVLNSLNGSAPSAMRDSLLRVSQDLSQNQNNAPSQDYLLLGKLFFTDKIVHLNTRLSLFLINRAAQKGNAEALMIMGDANNFIRPIALRAPRATNGLAIALEYYVEASNLGNFDAMAKMGELYIMGPRNIRKIQRGVGFIIESANAGSALGARFLGDLYMKGLGVKLNRTKALQWYKKATPICELNDNLSTARDYARYYNSCKEERSITPGYKLVFEEF